MCVGTVWNRSAVTLLLLKSFATVMSGAGIAVLGLLAELTMLVSKWDMSEMI
jgi:hypothetical protein